MGASPTAKVRLEKRAGSEVTVIAGLHTYGTSRLQDIARELKLKFGTGGSVKDGKIEIQGDRVLPIRTWFKEKQSRH